MPKKKKRGKKEISRQTTRRLLQEFGGNIWAHRWSIFGSYLAGMISIGAALLLPWPLKIIIDNVLSGKVLPEPLATVFVGISAEKLVVLLSLLFLILTCIRALSGAFQKIANAKIRESLVIEIRDRILHHIQTLSIAFHSNARSGELAFTVTSDVHQVVRLFTKTLPIIIRHLVSALLILGTIFWMEYRIGIVALLIVIALSLLMRRYAKILKNASRQKRRREGDIAGLAQEIMRNLLTIQALGHERHTRERFKCTNVKGLREGVNEARIAVALERTLQIARGIAVGAVLGGGAFLVLKGIISLGELTVLLSYMTQLLNPIEKINELASTVSRALARGEQVLLLLEKKPLVEDGSNTHYIKQSKGLLEFRNVSFSYSSLGDPSCQSLAPVLRDVSLIMQPGKIYALRGPSGSGKSTLLNLCLRLFDPTSGEIYLDGQPLSQIKLKSLRSQFAVVLQTTNLFAGSIRDVLAAEEDDVTDSKMWEALTLVALDNFTRSLPRGLDSRLNEDGTNFSGGQRTRLSLARALLLNRSILILDEPLANVDPTSQTIILDALETIRSKKTCLIISHQPIVLNRADAVFELQNGSIKELKNEKSIGPKELISEIS